jgi:hypothetical protein
VGVPEITNSLNGGLSIKEDVCFCLFLPDAYDTYQLISIGFFEEGSVMLLSFLLMLRPSV